MKMNLKVSLVGKAGPDCAKTRAWLGISRQSGCFIPLVSKVSNSQKVNDLIATYPGALGIRRTLDNIVIVGLPDAAVKESRDRVTTALINSGFNFTSTGYASMPSTWLTICKAVAVFRATGTWHTPKRVD